MSSFIRQNTESYRLNNCIKYIKCDFSLYFNYCYYSPLQNIKVANEWWTWGFNSSLNVKCVTLTTILSCLLVDSLKMDHRARPEVWRKSSYLGLVSGPTLGHSNQKPINLSRKTRMSLSTSMVLELFLFLSTFWSKNIF